MYPLMTFSGLLLQVDEGATVAFHDVMNLNNIENAHQPVVQCNSKFKLLPRIYYVQRLL